MTLHRTDRDLPGLTVLALLMTGPRHTYEMHRMIVDFHKDFVTGLPRSMYHSVKRLSRDGYIRVAEVTSEHGRPDRTVYALTDTGRTQLAGQVRRLLATPDPDTDLFVAGLSFAGCLPPAEVVTALRERCAALAGRLSSARAEVATVTDRLPRLLLIDAEFSIARLTAEHDWVAAVLRDLESGSLPWPDDLTTLAEVSR